MGAATRREPDLTIRERTSAGRFTLSGAPDPVAEATDALTGGLRHGSHPRAGDPLGSCRKPAARDGRCEEHRGAEALASRKTSLERLIAHQDRKSTRLNSSH